MTFKYIDNESIQTGNITIFSSDFPIEADVEANGWNFHIIVGEHINGKYICIPNWSIGSELAELSDTFWNCERLQNYTNLSKYNSNIIASALAEINKHI